MNSIYDSKDSLYNIDSEEDEDWEDYDWEDEEDDDENDDSENNYDND